MRDRGKWLQLFVFLHLFRVLTLRCGIIDTRQVLERNRINAIFLVISKKCVRNKLIYASTEIFNTVIHSWH